MICDIYRSSDRSSLFLVVPEGVSPDSLPPVVRSQLGQLIFFKRRDISSATPLIGANQNEVLGHIAANGFHIGGVEIKSQVSEAGAAIGGGMLGATLGGGPIGALIGAIIGVALAQQSNKGGNDGNPR